ncbi:D-glucuronyl C5-epimerase family protein [Hyunsoonleella pacifica]|uniref:D-glucuronyl C5-epimerase C-terminal domain-containing protein n=1 Tax=Hyunsoonleella pacifica TaxID=1080224 RepID=A0A4Q9FSN2_9FLAO|nr:D-glucuronyl C5-epimerase family protein [Hyunsoonleella pacifica]TBN16737.1 hypothetical protein EYD46_08895 [Hyunsoonleella pacifica]GGD16878.1 hypothetical protein GCM10011368_18560 [Hyunsoonleella pacifica]
MNFYFKIKHYLFLYFKTEYHYFLKQEENEELCQDYWIKGYKVNIESRKWSIENGIPLGLYNGKINAPLKYRVHISGLCEYCFALREVGQQYKQEKVVDFLLKNLDTDKINLGNDFLKFSFWKTYANNDLDQYYVHGMGQGQILSLLTRYALKRETDEIEKTLIEVSNSYLIPFNHIHGFVNLKTDNNVIFEEYPKNVDRPHVLNGWIYSLLGLYDYIQYASLKSIEDNQLNNKKRVFNDSVRTLHYMLEEYNLGFWSLYNLPKKNENICSIHYQEQHIVLLRAIGKLTSDKHFINYSNIFQKQYNNIFYRFLALFTKVFISNLIKHKWIYKTN